MADPAVAQRRTAARQYLADRDPAALARVDIRNEITAADALEAFKSQWGFLPDVTETLAAMPPPVDRLSTGFPSLDRCLRGGLALGRVYTFVGPPSRGKTALVAQLALLQARERGAIVIGLFCDEGAWQAALMMAEGIGFDRRKLEDDFESVRPLIEDAFRKADIRLPDPDAPETVLDSAELWLSQAPAAVPKIIVVDSIQTVRCRRGADAKSPKERADAMMQTCRSLSRRLNAIVLATSKANRSSFAHKDKSENIERLAGGLDSSAIEYESDFLSFLDGDPKDVVSLHVEKNRPGDGSKPAIPLRFDRDRASFREIDEETSEAEEKSTADTKRAAQVSAAAEKIEKVLSKFPEISGSQIFDRIRGNRAICFEAIEQLSSANRIVCSKGQRNAFLWKLTE